MPSKNDLREHDQRSRGGASLAELCRTNEIGCMSGANWGNTIKLSVHCLGDLSEPFKVRLRAEHLKGKVMSDGTFTGTATRLLQRGHIFMEKIPRTVMVANTSRTEHVNIYRLTEAGMESLLSAADLQPLLTHIGMSNEEGSYA